MAYDRTALYFDWQDLEGSLNSRDVTPSAVPIYEESPSHREVTEITG